MFDPRAAKALMSGAHLTVPGAPGLRLVATQTRRTWVYRYKSPADGRMRQIRLGHWPAMGLPAALAAWERAKQSRDSGADLAAEKRQKRAAATSAARVAGYTVRDACSDFLAGYGGTVTPKTYAEADRLLTRELGAIEARPAASITRADAFDLLDAMRDRPVVAGALRTLLGAVWERAHDSGRLAPDVPNWWRQILRGKLRSKGKIVGGEHQGVEKRVLTEAELRLLLPWWPNFSRDVEDALTLQLWTGCRGAEVVAIDLSPTLVALARDLDLPFPYVLDASQDVAKAYGVAGSGLFGVARGEGLLGLLQFLGAFLGLFHGVGDAHEDHGQHADLLGRQRTDCGSR